MRNILVPKKYALENLGEMRYPVHNLLLDTSEKNIEKMYLVKDLYIDILGIWVKSIVEFLD